MVSGKEGSVRCWQLKDKGWSKGKGKGKGHGQEKGEDSRSQRRVLVPQVFH